MLLSAIFYIIFVLAAIVLITVILLQEGKGGGFGEALGSAGRETFGVGASGINKFTGVVATVFLVSALLIHFINRENAGGSVTDTGTPNLEAPVDPGAGAAPAGTGNEDE